MASIPKYRDSWLRQHRKYERAAYKRFKQTFNAYAENISWDAMNANNYERVIEMSVNEQLMFQTYYDVYYGIGTVHGLKIGKTINKQLKQFEPTVFETIFQMNLKTWLRNWQMKRVVSVENTYKDTLNNLILKMIDDGKSMPEIVKEMQKIVNKPNFYKWEAMRIARTETTTAANYAATQASEVSGYVMDKMWISALDFRTRTIPFDHRAMNGKRVKEKADFVVSGEKLAFPGDPKGSAANIINCRCTVAIVPKRDSNGDLIEKII